MTFYLLLWLCTSASIPWESTSFLCRFSPRQLRVLMQAQVRDNVNGSDEILRAVAEAQYHCSTRFISQSDSQSPVFHEGNSMSIVLIDLSVRSLEEVELAWPFWEKFRAKMDSSKQSLIGEKFLFSHDVGDNHIHRISIARIPAEMYQKLALARALVGGSGKEDRIVVTMLGQYGERFVDVDMCEALQAGCEASCYQMPTFKYTPINERSSLAAAKTTSTIAKRRDNTGLLCVAPDALFDAAAAVASSSCSGSSSVLEDAATNLPWHYFSRTEAEGILRHQKISALEAAMMTSTGRNQEAAVDADESSRLVNQNMLIRGTRSFNSLQQVETYLRHSSAANEGTNIARALASLPPNVLNPQTYVKALKTLAATRGWDMEEWTVGNLQKIGAGAFCAVCQGNSNAPGENETSDRLVRLRFSSTSSSPSEVPACPSSSLTLNNFLMPERQAASLTTAAGDARDLQRAIVLVGKGVTYDTGGLNMKTANSMKTMKHDMAGSSVALGIFTALSHMKFSRPVECWLAIAENNLGVGAFRPDDVVTSVTGETIEIVHTDAEGRMLLADVLAIASRKVRIPSIHGVSDVMSPKYLFDFATLTGTCITSLSNRYIGAYANRPELVRHLIRAGERSGERVWPFPCDDDFNEDLKSDVADVLQCRQPTEADHIYAASFLKRFVSPTVSWVHFDLSSSHRPGGLGHIASDYTGTGVRAALELLGDLCSKREIHL